MTIEEAQSLLGKTIRSTISISRQNGPKIPAGERFIIASVSDGPPATLKLEHHSNAYGHINISFTEPLNSFVTEEDWKLLEPYFRKRGTRLRRTKQK